MNDIIIDFDTIEKNEEDHIFEALDAIFSYTENLKIIDLKGYQIIDSDEIKKAETILTKFERRIQDLTEKNDDVSKYVVKEVNKILNVLKHPFINDKSNQNLFEPMLDFVHQLSYVLNSAEGCTNLDEVKKYFLSFNDKFEKLRKISTDGKIHTTEIEKNFLQSGLVKDLHTMLKDMRIEYEQTLRDPAIITSLNELRHFENVGVHYSWDLEITFPMVWATVLPTASKK